MNAKRVAAAAGVILAAQQVRQTAAGIAVALESAQLLRSPESAAESAELETLREQVATLLAERHTTNAALAEVTVAGRAAETERDALRARLARMDKPLPEDEYPPVMPWALLMDANELTEFLVALANAICHSPLYGAVWEIEETCATWRATAEAKHAQSTGPSPAAEDAERALLARIMAPDEPGDCDACGDGQSKWCPDCAACRAGCHGGHVDNPCTHAKAPWGGAS